MTTNVDRAAEVIDAPSGPLHGGAAPRHVLEALDEIDAGGGYYWVPGDCDDITTTTETGSLTMTNTDQPKTAYLTGPTTGHPDYNFPAFHLAAARLRELGLTVLSPAEDDENDPLTPPSHAAEWPHQAYLLRSLRMLLDCDVIFLLPGWDSCTGAQLERQVASACGLAIFEMGEWPW